MEILRLAHAFLDLPGSLELSELAEALEDDPRGGPLVQLAQRAIYLEDQPLAHLLDQAILTTQRLIKDIEGGE